jgi:hypothetical protein
MNPNQQPTVSPYAENVLGHTLTKIDEHGQHHSRLAEAKLVKDDQNAQHTHRLLEANVTMHDKTQTAIKDSGDKVANAVKDMAASMAPKEIADQAMFCVKGVKGDKGEDSTVVGPRGDKGDSIKGDKGDSIKGDKGDPGKDSVVPGPRGLDGKDGISIIGPQGGMGKPGPRGPAGKDGKDAAQDVERIASLINPYIDFNKIKGVPELGKRGWAGTGYLREISDVNTTGLQHGQVLVWNATTNKWEPGTPVSSSSGASGYQSATGTVDGANQTFTFATAPNIIVVDGISLQKTEQGGSSNWSGTTVVVMTVPPVGSIFGL